jgi:hypothetical protein
MAMADTSIASASISPSISISAAMTIMNATIGLRRMSAVATDQATQAQRLRIVIPVAHWTPGDTAD